MSTLEKPRNCQKSILSRNPEVNPTVNTYPSWSCVCVLGGWGRGWSGRKQRNARVLISLLFSHSVVSNSLWPQGLRHVRLPCASPSPRVCSNSCPLSQWCYLTITFSALLFSSCPRSFPASGSLPMSWLCIRWPNDWSFNFSISPSNEYSGLISLRIKWFDLLAVQGTLKSLLQHHSSKASILQRSAFFMVQLSS